MQWWCHKKIDVGHRVPPPGKHISLVICVPLPRKHISLEICVPLPGKLISLLVCVPLPRKHVSLVICVPAPGKHVSLVIRVPPVGKHVSLVICVPLPGKDSHFFRLQVCLNPFFLSRSSCLSAELLRLWEIFSLRDCNFLFLFRIPDRTILFVIGI